MRLKRWKKMSDKKYVYVVIDGDCSECGNGGIEGVFDDKKMAEIVAQHTLHHGDSFSIELNAIPLWIKREMEKSKTVK